MASHPASSARPEGRPVREGEPVAARGPPIGSFLLLRIIQSPEQPIDILLAPGTGGAWRVAGSTHPEPCSPRPDAEDGYPLKAITPAREHRAIDRGCRSGQLAGAQLRVEGGAADRQRMSFGPAGWGAAGAVGRREQRRGPTERVARAAAVDGVRGRGAADHRLLPPAARPNSSRQARRNEAYPVLMHTYSWMLEGPWPSGAGGAPPRRVGGSAPTKRSAPGGHAAAPLRRRGPLLPPDLESSSQRRDSCVVLPVEPSTTAIWKRSAVR